jgi:hypothetical protein
MGRQESVAGTSSRGSRPPTRILGHWKRSAEVGDDCIEISSHFPALRLNKPGPGQGHSLEGAPSNYHDCGRGNFVAAVPIQATTSQ